MVCEAEAIHMTCKELKKEDELKDELLIQGKDVICDCINSRKKKYDASEMKVDEKKEGNIYPPAKKIAQSKDQFEEIKSPEYFSDEIEEGEIIDDISMELDSDKG